MVGFFKQFFNALLRRTRFKQIGRSHYNPQQEKLIPQHGIAIWPGFQSALQKVERGVLLNIDISHKVLRTATVLSQIEEVRNRARGDPTEAIKKMLVGQTIMTSYNKRTYKVDDIDFTISPMDTFTCGDQKTGEEKQVSYIEYFKTKYGQEVKDINQPALISINARTGMKLVLLPELCQMSGLTDSMRANFQLMKEMSQTTHADARRRVQECKALLESFD